ncbi:DUF1275 domain-containing protein [Treponema parvum]|uniref:DUF1275 domain-containing protein n=1 Tax=Treponema parvum TaxID=138851 RepID=A0A975IBN7_9SPIR|nr:YoaK family protein [Treponema parvum]QTQ10993.1 DUF1275 domain-containing protein [Treponema parvum]
METKIGKNNENIKIGICLSLLGGFLDSYSYILKGNVFANAQTGNVVLIFIALANREFNKSVKYLIPVVTFAVGIFISELLKTKRNLRSHIRLKMILILEAVLIACIAFFGKNYSNHAVNCVISFIAAVQVANFDRIDNSPIATTMITGNLKSGMIQLSQYIHTKNRDCLYSFIKYMIVICNFGIGVIIGCVSIRLYSEYSILVCEIFLISTYITIEEDKTGLP